MRDFPRPRLFASRCLGFARCRWNGETITDDLVERLRVHVDYVTECPEVSIGLGVPREPIRVVKDKAGLKLMQPATGRDCSREMAVFADAFLLKLGEVDGFILKSRSPSCGIKDVKVYPSIEKSPVIGKGSGFFGSRAIEMFPGVAVEDEARLNDFRIREQFLTRIFLSAEFRRAKARGSMKGLVDLHSGNKYMLMAASQRSLSALGRIVANHDKLPARDVFAAYGEELGRAMAKGSRYRSNINALMHALGYVSKGMRPKEKAYFLEMLEKYRKGRVPFSVPLGIMRELVIRFEEPYLMRQSFFEPYPEELMLVTDSGKGRLR